MRKITEERIRQLEKTSIYHRDFMYSASESFDILLKHLGLKIEVIQKHRVLRPLAQSDMKKGESENENERHYKKVLPS